MVVVSSYADGHVLFVVNHCCDGTEEVPLSTMLYALLFLSEYTPFGRNQVESSTTLFGRNITCGFGIEK